MAADVPLFFIFPFFKSAAAIFGVKAFLRCLKRYDESGGETRRFVVSRKPRDSRVVQKRLSGEKRTNVLNCE